MAGAQNNITLNDIARLAGVGVGTASRALSNASRVAPATRQRVLDVADALGYVVSPAAASLAKGTTGRVALVVPHLSRWFFGSVVEGLDSVLRSADFDVLLYQVRNVDDRRDFFERLPARRKVDAVVVVAFPVEEFEQQRLKLMGVQIVSAGGRSAVYPYIGIDDYAAGKHAVDHLLRLGHRRIAMLEAVDPDEPHLESGRSAAYDGALAEHGIPVDPTLVITDDWGGEQGALSMEKLISLPNRPTAVFAHSDEVALGAIRTLRRAGLQVPQDMSVIGIDDHPLAQLTDLTTVRQQPRQQGALAATMLLQLLRGEENVEQFVTVPTELVVRRTTAHFPG